ncbi:anaerobic ribonucleoside-triphosphate reductase activating protein [Fulvivirga maritima]|uniref:anaerobic ribonucleoside-triphosphate reductase activating protein n=1 Tax=Fulvivirga maritima TaxID=2904247 RepID=UPI001F1FBB4F|nr:anaerobic ribonucleoside-triphosphate reductase activating protein [Fulvivirga maritima]UII27187.1 anaerobic ribonucleoside-triphosphate reductase activating protein [Fulvivirga maritima]
MNYSEFTVTTQEVPGEISLCLTITGCPIHCKGCHSPYLWKPGSGQPLTDRLYHELLERYKGQASCVLFMGGEWHPIELAHKLEQAKSMGYNTCLYTGKDKLDSQITRQLTWVKYGPWKSEKGGLDSPDTNQRFIKVATNELLNHLFIKK